VATDLGWLNYVPGARAAYDYLATKMGTFFATGPALRKQFAELQRVWGSMKTPLPGQITPAQQATLNAWGALHNQLISEIHEWDALEPRARQVWDIISRLNKGEDVVIPPNLGVFPAIPVALLIQAATALVGLKLLLDNYNQRVQTRQTQQNLTTMLQSAVSSGLITPGEAGKIIAAGETDFWSQAKDLLIWGGAIVGGVIVLQSIMPAPRRRR
jgi:hypothetical protein